MTDWLFHTTTASANRFSALRFRLTPKHVPQPLGLPSQVISASFLIPRAASKLSIVVQNPPSYPQVTFLPPTPEPNSRPRFPRPNSAHPSTRRPQSLLRSSHPPVQLLSRHQSTLPAPVEVVLRTPAIPAAPIAPVNATTLSSSATTSSVPPVTKMVASLLPCIQAILFA